MVIIDASLIKAITKITCSILHYNFFYDMERIAWFIQTLTDEMANDIDGFEKHADKGILDELRHDPLARLHFTCYFTSVHIRKLLLEGLHFNEQELQAFENILPKYIGEPRRERERNICE